MSESRRFDEATRTCRHVRPRLLILGGTSEAVDLARRCYHAFDVVSSLAGATDKPVRPFGEMRIGGFGGADGFEAYLRDARIDLVIDATHPFASRMQANAAAACTTAGVPRCRLARPEWKRRPGEKWIEVDGLGEAAQALHAFGKRVFLAIGARDLAAFSELDDRWFLVRAVTPPQRLPARGKWHLLQLRGPFGVEQEKSLLVEHQIDAVVTRQSGGDGARAKIDAARDLGLPVVMIRRPPPPEPPIVPSVDEAVAWLTAVVARGLAPPMPPGAV